jgi:hypothetical protein
VNDELWIAKNGNDKIEGQYRHLPGGTEKTTKNFYQDNPAEINLQVP